VAGRGCRFDLAASVKPKLRLRFSGLAPKHLDGIREHRTDSGNAAVQRFLFWGGTTGLTREAYYAGWEIIGQLLRGGMSFHEIATTPAVSFPALIAQAIASILGGGSH
jgi:hypothetical protein